VKIYFNASVSAKNEYLDVYKEIVNILRELGDEVIAEHILDYKISQRASETLESRRKYYYEMKHRIKSCDLMVAEISFPSTVHVGHELTLALDAGKPVLALFEKGKRPILFWGVEEEKFLVQEYTKETLREVVKSSIEYIMDQADTRFNFFISPQIGSYLDWVAKEKRVPRAVYLRRLIEEDMANNKKYLD
jgi:hypothetical protein